MLIQKIYQALLGTMFTGHQEALRSGHKQQHQFSEQCCGKKKKGSCHKMHEYCPIKETNPLVASTLHF